MYFNNQFLAIMSLAFFLYYATKMNIWETKSSYYFIFLFNEKLRLA